MTFQFSRVNPPKVLIPVNDNHLGARNEMVISNIEPPAPKIYKQTRKRMINQRITTFEDPNEARPTPLHPPYETNVNDLDNVQGKQMNTSSQAIVF